MKACSCTLSSLTSVLILFLSLGGVRLSFTTFQATSIPSFVSYARQLWSGDEEKEEEDIDEEDDDEEEDEDEFRPNERVSSKHSVTQKYTIQEGWDGVGYKEHTREIE